VFLLALTAAGQAGHTNAESFHGADHLRRVVAEAQTIVGAALTASMQQPGSISKIDSIRSL